jgi:hypothetical protein
VSGFGNGASCCEVNYFGKDINAKTGTVRVKVVLVVVYFSTVVLNVKSPTWLHFTFPLELSPLPTLMVILVGRMLVQLLGFWVTAPVAPVSIRTLKGAVQKGGWGGEKWGRKVVWVGAVAVAI